MGILYFKSFFILLLIVSLEWSGKHKEIIYCVDYPTIWYLGEGYYADDTIICLKDNLDMARNMKLLLYLYEMMSGLKINFSKSEVLLTHGDQDKSLSYVDIFNCQVGSFPIRYLWVPVSPSKLNVNDWDHLVDKNAKKSD